MFTTQALGEAFNADVVEALKSEAVPVCVNCAGANSKMGKKEAEAEGCQGLAHAASHPSLAWGDGGSSAGGRPLGAGGEGSTL